MASIVLFNKPFHVLSQFTDTVTTNNLNEENQFNNDSHSSSQARETLADYISIKGVYPAGRLDYDSEGLLILTNNGELQAKISHPKYKLAKTYWVQVEGSESLDAINTLKEGVLLNDGKTKPAKVKVIQEPKIWSRQPPVRQRQSIPTHWLEMQITEGRNRQVRRMTAAVGLPTLRLVRYKIGNWSLEDLAPGEHREMKVHLGSSQKVTNDRGLSKKVARSRIARKGKK